MPRHARRSAISGWPTFSHKRLANCEVRVTNEAGELIATFNGTGYRKETVLPFEPIQ